MKISRAFSPDLDINLGEHILTLMFPVRSSGMQRLIGLVPPELSHREKLGFEDIRSYVEPLLDIKVTEINWFSTYRVHHRVADKFRVGRAFLVGDAGHIHSPVGGQGMNTGIGDAVNLGWKLAQVMQRRADESLLETYEPERIGFARSLVSTTDRAFTGLVGEGLVGELTRKVFAPLLFGVVTCFNRGRHAIFRTISQTRSTIPTVRSAKGSPVTFVAVTVCPGSELTQRITSCLCALWIGRHMCTARRKMISKRPVGSFTYPCIPSR